MHTKIWITVLLAFISYSNGEKAIKCYICNTAYPTDVRSEDSCRYPEKYPDFKPDECTENVLNDLNREWMNEEWIKRFINANDPPTQRHKRDLHWEFGYQKKEGYELKCMKEVLHKDSKEWLKHKPANFSQIVRFCEYVQVNPPPKKSCDKSCTSQELSTGSCFTCCSKDGCNDGNSLTPIGLTFVLITFAILCILRN